MKLVLAIGLLIASVALSACGADSKTPGSFHPYFEDAASSSAAAFSFQYVADPPDGRQLLMNSIPDVTDTCAMFQGSPTPQDFESASIVLSGSARGSYAVDSQGDASSPWRADVKWVQVVDGKVVARASAVSGSVEYLAGPESEADWPSVREAAFKVHAAFELDPVAKSECASATNIATGETHSSCSCARLSGTQFTCDSIGRSCCGDQVGEVKFYDFEIQANACAAECAFTDPDLVSYCRALE